MQDYMGYSCSSVQDGNWWVEELVGISRFGVEICAYSILIQSGLGVKENVLVIGYLSCKPYSRVKTIVFL